ncbi:MAG: mRNA-decapping enzyme subunit 2 [Chrysothrix sp. TS-e1954]|nr:MAG: mRNA-decapping enzyme subunit 2 [Chrysothrix sp. TS-e1954]
MQLVDWLDDLCVRFIINLPQEELESVERICFQVEEAQWFYEDFIRPLDASLPSLSLRDFCLAIFQHCPLFAGFSQDHHLLAFSEFLAYKTRVPVRGAILLDETLNYVLLVKGWKKGANWSFPRGKINKDERDLDCAVREVYEETGFDLEAAGLTINEAQIKFIEVTMREQHMKLYVCKGVSTDTHFQPRTRKEISKIQWWRLDTLPGYNKKKSSKHNDADGQQTIAANKVYMVAPFLSPLRKWITYQRKEAARQGHQVGYDSAFSAGDELVTDGEVGGNEDNILTALDPSKLLAPFGRTGSSEGQFEDIRAHYPTQGNLTSLPSADVTAQLKQSLGIVPPKRAPSQPNAGAPASSSLLALLRQGKKPEHAEAPNESRVREAHPQTLFDGHDPNAVQPHSQHNHHVVNQDVHGAALPSRLPLPTLHRQQPQMQGGPFSPINGAQTGGGIFNNVSMTASVPSNTHSQNSTLHQSQQQMPNNMPPHQYHVGPHEPTFERIPPHYRLENHQRAGAPYGQSDASNVPPAESLPQPNLSSHAMKLLNTLKTGSKSPMPSNAATPRQAASSPFDATPRSPAIEQSAQGVPSRRSSTAQNFRGLIPSSVLAATASRQSSQPPTPTGRKPSAQQDALLRLFQSPPAVPAVPAASKVPTVSAAPTAPPTSAEPVHPKSIQMPTAGVVELSAIASPRPPEKAESAKPAAKAVITKHENERGAAPVTPKILQRPAAAKQQKPAETPVATLGAPHNEPVLDTSRRKARASKAGTNGEKAKGQGSVTPVQILKRPAEARKEVKPTHESEKTPQKSPLPAHANVFSNSGKPFQPQILKRPQQSPQSPAPAKPHSALEAATEPVEAHQKALFSLLNGGGSRQQQVPSSNASPVESPHVSRPAVQTPTKAIEPSANNARNVASPSVLQQLSRSRISSVASAPREPREAPSTPQTPLSPADRTFLLKYLGSVVGEASK